MFMESENENEKQKKKKKNWMLCFFFVNSQRNGAVAVLLYLV